MNLKEKIKANPRNKEIVMWFLFGNGKPRLWVRIFVNPFFHKAGKNSVKRRYARLDVIPWRKFSIGSNTIIEDYSCINNQVGDVQIGDNCTIGIGNILIGPLTIGNNVILAQHVCLSGLNHGYLDINVPIRDQPCDKKQITLADDCWVGANSVILLGITIGKHAIVAAGSVVTKDVAPYTIVGGNPAKLLKKYNEASGLWEKP